MMWRWSRMTAGGMETNANIAFSQVDNRKVNQCYLFSYLCDYHNSFLMYSSHCHLHHSNQCLMQPTCVAACIAITVVFLTFVLANRKRRPIKAIRCGRDIHRERLEETEQNNTSIVLQACQISRHKL